MGANEKREATFHGGDPTDAELVAKFDDAYNARDDGTVRVPVLEAAGLRAVFNAGRDEGGAGALDGLVWGLTGAWEGKGGPSLGEVVRFIRERAAEYRGGATPNHTNRSQA